MLLPSDLGRRRALANFGRSQVIRHQAQASTADKSHTQLQAEIFDAKADFFDKPLPANIEKRLARIVAAVPLDEHSRVLDFGSGACALSQISD